MMKKIILILSILCLWHASVCAIDKVAYLSGKITDNNNLPIPNASIVIDQLDTYSQEDGSFKIKLLTGSHKVKVICFGYEPKEIPINIKADTHLNIQLTSKSIELATVQVHGKSKSQKLRESAYSINALEVRSKANEISNLNTLIGRSSGIKVREEGGVGSNFELSINGLSGNAIKYFVDGIPLSTMGSEISLANFPINLVERVEIYKGFVPAELGTDALGGAVNIITKRHFKNYLDASYGFGSFNTHKADFNAQYVDPKSKIVIRPSFSFNYSKNNYTMKNVEVKERYIDDNGIERSRFKTIDAKRFHDDYLSSIGRFAVGVVNKKWADSFFISATYSAMNKELQTGAIQNVVYGKAEKENRSFGLSANYEKKDFIIKNLSTSLSVAHTWDKTAVIDTTFRKYWWDGSFDIMDSNTNEILKSGKSIKRYERPTTVGLLNLNYDLSKKHSLNLNYSSERTGNKRYDEIDTNFEPSNDVVSKHIFGLSYSLSLLDNKLSNILFVKDYINNLQIEQQDLSSTTGSNEVPRNSTKNNLGYGVASRYRFTNYFSVKASYEHAVRLPLARELLGNGTTVYPNFKLNPENSENLNLGIFGETNPNNKHHLFYEVQGFIRTVKDYIRYKSNPVEDRLGQYENLSNATVKGIEAEMKYSYDNLFQVIINGTYLEEKNKNKYLENGKLSATYNDRIPNKPSLYSNIEFNVKKQNIFGTKDNQLKFSYHFQYVHWYYYTWKSAGGGNTKSKIPTQCINDLSLTYSLRNEKYNISMECSNIFDRMAYDNLKLQKPGRAFFCKMRLFFN